MKNNCGYGYSHLFYTNHFLMKCRLSINTKPCTDIEQPFFMSVQIYKTLFKGIGVWIVVLTYTWNINTSDIYQCLNMCQG